MPSAKTMPEHFMTAELTDMPASLAAFRQAARTYAESYARHVAGLSLPPVWSGPHPSHRLKDEVCACGARTWGPRAHDEKLDKPCPLAPDEEVNFLDLPRDQALILDGADSTFACLVFNISTDLLARIELIGGGDAFKCETHQALVLNHLLELGTRLKEADLAAEVGQESLF